MKILLKNLVEAKEAIELLLQGKLPFCLSYSLGRLNEKLKSDYKPFAEQREKLIKQYGYEESKGCGRYRVDICNLEEYGNEINKLTDTEVEIPIEQYMIPISKFEGITTNGKYIDRLLIFIKEDEKKENK